MRFQPLVFIGMVVFSGMVSLVLMGSGTGSCGGTPERVLDVEGDWVFSYGAATTRLEFGLLGSRNFYEIDECLADDGVCEVVGRDGETAVFEVGCDDEMLCPAQILGEGAHFHQDDRISDFIEESLFDFEVPTHRCVESRMSSSCEFVYQQDDFCESFDICTGFERDVARLEPYIDTVGSFSGSYTPQDRADYLLDSRTCVAETIAVQGEFQIPPDGSNPQVVNGEVFVSYPAQCFLTSPPSADVEDATITFKIEFSGTRG